MVTSSEPRSTLEPSRAPAVRPPRPSVPAAAVEGARLVGRRADERRAGDARRLGIERAAGGEPERAGRDLLRGARGAAGDVAAVDHRVALPRPTAVVAQVEVDVVRLAERV